MGKLKTKSLRKVKKYDLEPSTKTWHSNGILILFTCVTHIIDPQKRYLMVELIIYQ